MFVGHLPPKMETAMPMNGIAEEVKVKQEMTQILTDADEQDQENLMKCSVKMEMNTDDCKDHTMTESKMEEAPGILSSLSAQPSPMGTAATPGSDLNKSDPGAMLAAGNSAIAKLQINKKGI